MLAAARSWMGQRVQRLSWRHLISTVVLVLCLGFLGYKAYTSWEAIQTYDWQIRYWRLAPTFVIYLGQLLIVVWGWQSLMNSLVPPLPFRAHLKIYSYTNLMRRIPAGVLWATLGRVHAYKKQEVSARSSAVATFLEILMAILTGVPLALLAGVALGFLSPWTGVALVALAVVLELGAIHPVVLSKIFDLVHHDTLPAKLTYRKTLLWVFIFTLAWLGGGVVMFAVARIFADLSLASLPQITGVWILSSLVAFVTLLTPSGLGVRELSITLLLGTLMPDPLPLLIALATRAIWTACDLVVGAIAWVAP